MRTRPSRSTKAVVLGLFAGCVAVPVLDPAARPAWSAPTGCRAPAPAALAGFFDRTVPDRLAHDRVPGAVVSVAAGGGTAFAEGYGLADTRRGVPMDPSRSLVRIGSITKLFTWTAVMQQVEAGRLDLDADVNRYLTAFKIPATHPEPVTLRSLMNHTAGFEDRVIGTGARASADVPPLGEYLARHMPARIRPPGEISAYSNYGAALAGHIVSQVSGEPYDAYVQHHLLAPLGMAHSTAAEPVPEPLAAGLARSYDSDAEPPQKVPFTFDAMPPDGSVSATAGDMANLMVAYLNDGRFGGKAILSPAAAAQMYRRSFAADPRLGGYAHGFMARTVNGRQVLMHDGSWEGFQSALVLVPECDLGVFLSANGTGGTETVAELTRAFLDRFAPPRTAPGPAPASRPTAAPRAGFYKPTRHNESTIEKILVLLGPMRLRVDGDGTVRFKGGKWTPQGDGLYSRTDGRDHLVFLTGADGRRYVATDGPAYQLMSTWEAPIFNLSLLLVFFIAAFSALAVPLTALWRRLSRRPAAATGTWRAARALASGAAVLGLGFLVLLTAQLLGDTGDFLYGVPPAFRALLVVPVIVLVTTIAAAACTVMGWRGSGATLAARIHQVAVFTGLAALTWFLWQWNLIGWQF